MNQTAPQMGASGGPTGPRRYFPSLNGLRTIAMLAVAGAHAGSYFPPPETVLRWGGALFPCAVIFFFMITGFLMYRPYLARNLRRVSGEAKGTVVRRSRHELLVYYGARAVRIFPLYWLVLTTKIVLLGPGVLDSPMDWLQVYLLLPLPDPAVLINGGLGFPTWTLSVAVLFYLVLPGWAALSGRVMRTGFGRADPFRAEAVSLGGLMLVMILPMLVVPNVPNVLVFIVAGMGFAAISLHEDASGRPQALLSAIGRHWLLCMLAVLTLWAVGIAFDIVRAVDDAARVANVNDSVAIGGNLYLGFGVWTIMALAFTIPAIFGPQDSPFNQFFSSRPMFFLGLISYGFYLWHPVVLQIVADAIGDRLFWVVYLTVTCSAAVATASYLWFERPIDRAWLRWEGAGSAGRETPQPI